MRAAVLLFGAPREQRKKPISEFGIEICFGIQRQKASFTPKLPATFPKICIHPRINALYSFLVLNRTNPRGCSLGETRKTSRFIPDTSF